MRTSSIAGALLFAGAAPLLCACESADWADDCHNLLTCPPADAGASNGCAGTCVPGSFVGWSDPFLVRLGDVLMSPLTSCPTQASDFRYYGIAPPPAPVCGGCTCAPSTGTCALPPSMTANAGTCAATGSGTAFDPPSPWDGSCTVEDAVTGGVLSVTVAPLVPNDDGCAPVPLAVPQSLPSSPVSALGCAGYNTSGACPNSGQMCQPALPSSGPWTYCVEQTAEGNGSPTCPPHYYTHMYSFATAYTDTRACSSCTCGPPAGSGCSSLVSLYADGACADETASVTAVSSASMCVDVPAGSTLGSKSASRPAYEPGTCTAGGGAPTGSLAAEAPYTFCCLD